MEKTEKQKKKILNKKPKAREPKKRTRKHDFFKGRLFSAANKKKVTIFFLIAQSIAGE